MCWKKRARAEICRDVLEENSTGRDLRGCIGKKAADARIVGWEENRDKEREELQIRESRENDIAEIAALEKECFTDPWSEESLRDAAGTRSFVATEGESVVGYIITRCVAGEAELFRICVKSEARGKGTGRLLLKEGLEAAKADGAEKMFLEVRSRNVPARALYASAGFEEAGLRKGYYSDPEDDAVILVKHMDKTIF